MVSGTLKTHVFQILYDHENKIAFVAKNFLMLLVFGVISLACASDGPSLVSIPKSQQPDVPTLNTPEEVAEQEAIEVYADIPDETIEDTFIRIQSVNAAYATVNSQLEIVQVFSQPDPEKKTTTLITNPGPFEGSRTLETTGRMNEEFLEVILPIAPNNTTGWIQQSSATLGETETLLIIDISERKAALFIGEDLILEAPVAIGAAQTPTPAVEAIIDTIWDRSTSETFLPFLYGQLLFGLNKHSEALEDFDGKRPALAIHGTDEPELIGSAVSNGCIRMHNSDIALFAEHVTLGTRVSIIG